MEEYFDGSIVPVCLTQADTFWPALFFILSIVIFFFLPLVILIILYTVIAKSLMENPVIISQNNKNNNVTGNSVLRYRKQVVIMLGTVVLSFFICLLPFRGLTLWIILVPAETLSSLGIEGYYILLYFCRIMLYLNSAVNPILYNLMSSKFREGFKKLLGCHKVRKFGTSSQDSGGRKNTFHTTSTNLSSSQTHSDSFWKRYSNRTTSQKSTNVNIQNGASLHKGTAGDRTGALFFGLFQRNKGPLQAIPIVNTTPLLMQQLNVKNDNEMKQIVTKVEVEETKENLNKIETDTPSNIDNIQTNPIIEPNRITNDEIHRITSKRNNNFRDRILKANDFGMITTRCVKESFV